MKRSDFKYELPEELIAQYPSEQRASSRLLVVNKSGELQDRQFRDVLDLITPQDLIVFNNSRVIPARLHGNKETGGQVEIMLERIVTDSEFLAMMRASKTPKASQEILLQEDHVVEVLGRQNDLFELKVTSDISALDLFENYGHMPLPPYIDREDEEIDQERYQTVYAENPGAVAAPTAGLHFDEQIMCALNDKAIEQAFITLHVGAGTFQPVREENIQDHEMHSEFIEVDKDVCDKIAACRARGGRVIAVGTTSLRCLEAASQNGETTPYHGDTDIFIYPGYEFQCVDALITNFHLSESTLLMLVSAFAGKENIMHAYQHAIHQGYKFFSYGDAMFLERDKA